MLAPKAIADWIAGELRSLATWLVSPTVSPTYGARCILFWFIVLFPAFCIKPARRIRWA